MLAFRQYEDKIMMVLGVIISCITFDSLVQNANIIEGPQTLQLTQ